MKSHLMIRKVRLKRTELKYIKKKMKIMKIMNSILISKKKNTSKQKKNSDNYSVYRTKKTILYFNIKILLIGKIKNSYFFAIGIYNCHL